ncbi:hypothetical protein Tco_0269422 [Tanacetum coccineum]
MQYPIFSIHDDGRRDRFVQSESASSRSVGLRPAPVPLYFPQREYRVGEEISIASISLRAATLHRLHALPHRRPPGRYNGIRTQYQSSSKGATAAGGLELDPTSPTMVVSPGSIYQPEWGVTNDCLLDTPSSCQELVDHLAPPGYFSELRHLPNEDFLGQFNMTLAWQVAMGSQLRLRFEQEAKLLRKSVAQVAHRDQRIQAMEGEKKNLETLLEAEADMRKAAKAKNAELVKEMESLHAQLTKLQVSRDGLSHQVSTLQAQVTGEEKIKAAFEEFKKYEDERVSARCAEMDSRLDALSIDFDEDLYPHMITAIAGRRWTFTNVVSARIIKGFCDGLKYRVEQGEAKLDLAMVEGYDPEAEGKFIATMQALKDLKYPLIDELKKLRDAPMDVLMASLYLESDTGGDAPQWTRDLHPSSS